MKETDNPAMCTVMGPQWVKEQRERQMRMDRLYVLDGRHLDSHEMHGFYTGLAEKAEELEKDLDE
tara:strand:+ start:811 stop:1005 length:195 start_codon:yes stop_codon:yes gene_type:complete